MNDYTKNMNLPSNSYKSKEQKKDISEKRVEKVVTGAVRTKKKSEARKFADVFISEDASNVKNYIFMDVLVPTIKKAISDMFKYGIDIILYGEAKKSGRKNNSSYVSYRSYSDNDRRSDYRRDSNRTLSGYWYDDIILENRGEAEAVLEQMDELIDAYGIVTVADLYDLIGITGNYTDNKYGWTSLARAKTVRTRDGRYTLDLPKAYPIN